MESPTGIALAQLGFEAFNKKYTYFKRFDNSPMPWSELGKELQESFHAAAEAIGRSTADTIQAQTVETTAKKKEKAPTPPVEPTV